MATNGNNQESPPKFSQSSRLDANGQVFTATLVRFSVGPHGPFTLMFAPGQATPEAVTAAITATVNQIIAADQMIAQLNQQNAR